MPDAPVRPGRVRSWVAAAYAPGRVPMGRTTDAFLRALGGVYLVALVSLWSQIDGLIGSGGILPAAAWAEWVRDAADGSAFAQVPSLVLLDASDVMLHLLCAFGVLGAILLVFGIVPIAAAAVSWLSYLSLTLAGQVFLGYQWDQLLLETGFLALFLAPPVIRASSRHAREPSRLFVWLARWLVFRLMLSSGLVKLVSGDPAWRELTALTYHYMTQPLPTWTAWFLHQAPDGFHQASAVLLFAVELVLPFFVFGPRRVRLVAAGGMIGLQGLILLTGNYGYFNLLSIVLCLMLLDDRALFGRDLRPQPLPWWSRTRWSDLVRVPVAAVLLLSSTAGFAGQFLPGFRLPDGLRPVRHLASTWRITATYGLFAVMTTRRPDLVLEGSHDGEGWKEYRFRWNPVALDQRPRFLTGHMPRLDWQIWFAALGPPERNVWLFMAMSRLLEGSEPVQGLLKDNPFPDKPPRYIRAIRYDYVFTDQPTLKATGRWWSRERREPYGPVLERPQ